MKKLESCTLWSELSSLTNNSMEIAQREEYTSKLILSGAHLQSVLVKVV